MLTALALLPPRCVKKLLSMVLNYANQPLAVHRHALQDSVMQKIGAEMVSIHR